MERKFFVPHSSDGASTLHVQDMQVTKCVFVDTLLLMMNYNETWTVDSGAPFHVTPKECFATFPQPTTKFMGINS